MLSVSKGASVEAVSGYFKQADYYSKEGEGSQGIWLGKGAKELGLYGKTVEEKDFIKYLDGQLPGRTPMGKMVDGERIRTVGWDNTFSSPSTVSVVIEVFGDKELDKNHTKSAHSLAKFIEAESLSVKPWNNDEKKQCVEKASKGLVAAFRHRTSRNLDPATHTHLFFINAAKSKDGKWLSLDSQTSFYNTKMLHGIIGRSEEAYGAKSLGRDIYTYSKDGKHYWDLKNIDKRLTDHFNSRSEEIKNYLGPGEHSAAAKAYAAKVTRQSKQTANIEDLKKGWRQKIQSLGFDFNKERDEALKSRPQMQRRSARSIYNEAISHLSEGHSSFTHNELLYAMLSRGLGDIRYPDAKREISRAAREKRLLINKDSPHAHERVFTTPALKQAEINLISLEQSGRQTRMPLYSRQELSRRMKQSDLNPSQAIALKQVILSTSSIIGIQGLAGVGKSYTAKKIVTAAELKDLKPIILAPSSSVTDDLSEDMKRNTRTLQSYLSRPEGDHKSLIILDEASMVGTNDMVKFLEIAKARNINRVVLMGDKRQLSSAQAGSPFALLQEAGMRTAVIDKVIRQQDEKHQEMVRHAYDGNIDEVFDILDKDLREVGYDTIDQATVEAWAKHPQRKSIAIVANTNARIDKLNHEVKALLKEQGDVQDDGITHKTYKAMNVSNTDKSNVGNYIHADAIRFYRSYKPLGIRAQKIYKIAGVDNDTGKVSLIGPKDKVIIFTPEKSAKKMGNFSLLKDSELELGVGDKISFTANDYNHDIKNKDVFIVSSLNETTVDLKSIKDETEKRISLSDPAMKFVKHAWAGTNHATQGKSVTGVIIAMAAHEKMTNQSSFYTAISRFKQKVLFFTDDKEHLCRTLKLRTAAPEHSLTKEEIRQIAFETKEQHEHQKALSQQQEIEKERTLNQGMSM